MRDFVLIYVNGRRHRVTGHDVFLSLSDYLRLRLGLTGTKVACAEGDCGACSVLVGRPSLETLQYRTVDSCIQFMFQLDGCHVVSVEGLRCREGLSPVQRALVEGHGSQCGFCTPGFVVAISGLLEQGDRLDGASLRKGLTGNLCRCTGYVPILEAGRQLAAIGPWRLSRLYPEPAMVADFRHHADQTIDVSCAGPARQRQFCSPTDLAGALNFLTDHPAAQVVAGATDVGVQINKRRIDPDVILDLNRVTDLAGVRIEDGAIVAGARASWTEVEQAVEHLVPPLHGLLARFGSPQIRNVATIGGNIANASPVADSVPFLFVMDAQLELAHPGGVRRVGVNDFYRGYKQTALATGELIRQVRIPLPAENQILRLYKVSQRRDLDIASFSAAILVRLQRQTITSAAVAFGGVGPTVLRARNTETFLAGRPLSLATMRAAGQVAVREVSPISDVRGSKQYRVQLTRNVLVKFYHDVQRPEATYADGIRTP